MVNTGKLLLYLELHGHRLCDFTCTEPMEYIVKLDDGTEAGIDYGLHNHPEHL